MDLPDIKLVVIYEAKCDLPTLWQRFGRAMRDLNLLETAILYVEGRHIKETDEQKTSKDSCASKSVVDGNELDSTQVVPGSIMSLPRGSHVLKLSSGMSCLA